MTKLLENLTTQDAHISNQAEESIKLEKSLLPLELHALPAKLQGIEALLVLVFLFALVFDFEEIFSSSIAPDLKIKLTAEELEQIDREGKLLGEQAQQQENERQ